MKTDWVVVGVLVVVAACACGLVGVLVIESGNMKRCERAGGVYSFGATRCFRKDAVLE